MAQLVRAPARRTGDPGSNSGPGEDFFFIKLLISGGYLTATTHVVLLFCLTFVGVSAAPQLLEDLLEEVKHVTHVRRHHLHLLLTPFLTNWASSHGIGDLLYAFRLLKVRCKVGTTLASA